MTILATLTRDMLDALAVGQDAKAAAILLRIRALRVALGATAA